jgi:hypothetical protein
MHVCYAAFGLGVSLSMPWGNMSGTTHGDWTSFTTEKPISCSQFGNTMRFTTIGIGSKSVNWALIETPPGVSDVYINVSTGTTPGGGAATYPAHLSRFARWKGRTRLTIHKCAKAAYFRCMRINSCSPEQASGQTM